MMYRRTSLALLLCLTPITSFAEDLFLPWPPELRGAVNRTASFSSDDLLRIPIGVAEASKAADAAQFTVAPRPPVIDLTFHDQLGPDAATRRLGRRGAISASPAMGASIAPSATTPTTLVEMLAVLFIAGTRRKKACSKSSI